MEAANFGVRYCKVEGCTEATNGCKDFCSDHVEYHPYVRNLMRRLNLREHEDEEVRREGSTVVNMEGITVKEILLHLTLSGPRTEERLAREVQVDQVIIHNCLVRLSKEGIIKFGYNARNSVSVQLIDFDPSKMIKEEK
jgi:hypothetical protein